MPFSQVFRPVRYTVLLVLCLLPACTSQTFPIPSLPPSNDGPLGDPARDAQARLLAEAHRAFAQARYPTAVLFFTRFIERSPDSPRVAEARWWLGQAHERTGDDRAAMQQYRIVAAGGFSQQSNGGVYEAQALRRLDELRGRHAADHTSDRHRVALRLPSGRLPEESGAASWLQELSSAGVAAVVIDVDPLPATAQGLRYLQRVKRLIADAHRLGLLVWLTFDVHRPSDIGLRPDWLGATLDGSAPSGVPSRTPDVTHTVYQAYLEKVLRELLETHCDGIFIPARSSGGFAAEFSAVGFRAFAASFGPALSPQDLFLLDPSAGGSLLDRTAWYWRWVGWKAASYATFLSSLATVLRASAPPRTLLIEVHQETLSNPLQGLEQYGEDLVALAQKTGGAIAVRHEAPGEAVLIEKLGQQLGAPHRVWTEILPVTIGDLFSVEGLIPFIGLDGEHGPRRPLLIAPQPIPAVP